MKDITLKNRYSLLIVFLALVSCNFHKSNSVYDWYLGDDSLYLYLTFNGDSKDKSKSKIKINKGDVSYVNDRFGNTNSAVHFSNQNYLSYGDVLDSVFSGKERRFSFSFWLKPIQSRNDVTIISKNSDSNCGENERQFNIKITKENKIQFIWLYNNADYNGYRFFESEKEISVNKWQNLVITYDGYSNGGDGAFRLRLYVNGENMNFIFKERRGKLGYIEDKSAHLGIGTMISSQGEVCLTKFYEGDLDDLMIFNRILNINEINQISSLKQ